MGIDPKPYQNEILQSYAAGGEIKGVLYGQGRPSKLTFFLPSSGEMVRRRTTVDLGRMKKARSGDMVTMIDDIDRVELTIATKYEKAISQIWRPTESPTVDNCNALNRIIARFIGTPYGMLG